MHFLLRRVSSGPLLKYDMFLLASDQNCKMYAYKSKRHSFALLFSCSKVWLGKHLVSKCKTFERGGIPHGRALLHLLAKTRPPYTTSSLTTARCLYLLFYFDTTMCISVLPDESSWIFPLSKSMTFMLRGPVHYLYALTTFYISKCCFFYFPPLCSLRTVSSVRLPALQREFAAKDWYWAAAWQGT